MSTVLDISVQHRLGAFTLDAGLRSDGRLTALFGASGSGKTSLVNIIGGLVKPQAGHVRLDGEALVDTAAGRVAVEFPSGQAAPREGEAVTLAWRVEDTLVYPAGAAA